MTLHGYLRLYFSFFGLLALTNCEENCPTNLGDFDGLMT